MENIVIRLEKKEEQREVENLVRESFWNGSENSPRFEFENSPRKVRDLYKKS